MASQSLAPVEGVAAVADSRIAATLEALDGTLRLISGFLSAMSKEVNPDLRNKQVDQKTASAVCVGCAARRDFGQANPSRAA